MENNVASFVSHWDMFDKLRTLKVKVRLLAREFLIAS